jgi:hypothetical protein
MRKLPTLSCRAVILGLGLLTAGPLFAALDEPSHAQLRMLDRRPDAAGELVYQGATYAQDRPGQPPLFRYERRVQEGAEGLLATHLTREPDGRLIIVESAQVAADYALQVFTVINQQNDFSGSVHVSADGRHLRYRLYEQGQWSSAEEEVSSPVLSGPSLHGFIYQHWAALVAGQSLPVRFIVLREKQTYGFTVRYDGSVDGQAHFSLSPSSFWVGLVVAPLRLTFSAADKTLLRYEGRVPPQQSVAGKHEDLDARVEYSSVAASYR